MAADSPCHADEFVYLGLGSNISPRREHIKRAIALLRSVFPQKFVSTAVFETAPYGSLPQQAYLNCCVRFKTDETSKNVLRTALEIEDKIGRIRTDEKWGSRVIDIDILLYGQQVIKNKTLQIPHYDLSNRDFFLEPLLSFAPGLKNPETGNFLNEELARIPKEQRTHPQKIQFDFDA